MLGSPVSPATECVWRPEPGPEREDELGAAWSVALCCRPPAGAGPFLPTPPLWWACGSVLPAPSCRSHRPALVQATSCEKHEALRASFQMSLFSPRLTRILAASVSRHNSESFVPSLLGSLLRSRCSDSWV